MYSKYLIEAGLLRIDILLPENASALEKGTAIHAALEKVWLDGAVGIDLETWHKLKIAREDKEFANTTKHPRKSKGERKRNRWHLK
jgi:hypothetical protein